MPINCPVNNLGSDDCRDCRQQADGKCYWFFPSRAVNDILTWEERLVNMEAPIPPAWAPRQEGVIRQLRSEIQYLRKQVSELQNGTTKFKDSTRKGIAI